MNHGSLLKPCLLLSATVICIVVPSGSLCAHEIRPALLDINEREPGVWWGSRLGVHRDYRILRCMAGSVAVRNHLPAFSASRSIGAGLIFKAVSTAQALGCETFLAHVQLKNASFFRRLHWDVIGEAELYGIPHVKMRADLKFYPPACHDIPASCAA